MFIPISLIIASGSVVLLGLVEATRLKVENLAVESTKAGRPSFIKTEDALSLANIAFAIAGMLFWVLASWQAPSDFGFPPLCQALLGALVLLAINFRNHLSLANTPEMSVYDDDPIETGCGLATAKTLIRLYVIFLVVTGVAHWGTNLFPS